MLSLSLSALQRVLDNLIRNAVSYSYPGTAITLTMAREGDEAVLTVQNHGLNTKYAKKFQHVPIFVKKLKIPLCDLCKKIGDLPKNKQILYLMR